MSRNRACRRGRLGSHSRPSAWILRAVCAVIAVLAVPLPGAAQSSGGATLGLQLTIPDSINAREIEMASNTRDITVEWALRPNHSVLIRSSVSGGRESAALLRVPGFLAPREIETLSFISAFQPVRQSRPALLGALARMETESTGRLDLLLSTPPPPPGEMPATLTFTVAAF